MSAVDINMPVLTQFVSPQSGITLTVVGGSFGQVPEQDVLFGNAKRILMRASQDSRSWIAAWHSEDEDGPEADGVWVEVWDERGCKFHGVVDSVSRKIVQTG